MIDIKGNKITYFGHSTFSLTTPSGQVALIDPFVTGNPVCPGVAEEGFAARRDLSVPRALRPFRGPAGAGKAAQTEDRRDLRDLSMDGKQGIRATKPRPMGKGGSQQVGEFQVTMTHAFHSNSIDDGGKVVYAGEPAGLMIRMPGASRCITPGIPRCSAT